MSLVSVTIRGIDEGLIKQARLKALQRGLKTSEWLNDAIQEKLVRDAPEEPVFYLDNNAEATNTEGVYVIKDRVIKVGEDYIVNNRYICAAGSKGDEIAVTYMSPATLDKLGYRIFWIR